jgi:uncharacterized RDD family membrane protein YckC
MRYVGVGRRFLATLVDVVISVGWMYPFLEIEQSPGYLRVELPADGSVAYVIIALVYYIAMEAFFGATVGKFVAGIRVVRADGRRIDGIAALLRNLGRIVDFLPFAYLIGAIAVWTSPTRQRLGDRLAKTVVVEASSVGAPTGAPQTGWVPPAPTSPGHSAPPLMPPPPPVPGAHVPVPVPPPDPPGPPPADHRTPPPP